MGQKRQKKSGAKKKRNKRHVKAKKEEAVVDEFAATDFSSNTSESDDYEVGTMGALRGGFKRALGGADEEEQKSKSITDHLWKLLVIALLFGLVAFALSR